MGSMQSQSKIKVTLRLSISRPVHHGVRCPSGTHDNESGTTELDVGNVLRYHGHEVN
jgi:hypothetical protein